MIHAHAQAATRPAWRTVNITIVRPAWSVRVNPGAGVAGSGLRLIRSARRVEMLAGIPLGRNS